jgi:hypothetical protein
MRDSRVLRLVGEDPKGNRVYGRGKSGEGERGKSICSTNAEGAVLCTSSSPVSDREQRLLSLTYSTLFVGADIIIGNPYYGVITDKVSTLGRVPSFPPSTQVKETVNNLFIQPTKRLCSFTIVAEIQTTTAPPQRLLYLGFSEFSRFGAVKTPHVI